MHPATSLEPRPVLRLVSDPDPLDQLTARELEILALIAEGLTNQAIREQLFIAPKTLERHIRHIFAKLDVSRPDGSRNLRVAAALIWVYSPSGGGATRR